MPRPGHPPISAAATFHRTRSQKARIFTFSRRITSPEKRYTECAYLAFLPIDWCSILKTSPPCATGLIPLFHPGDIQAIYFLERQSQDVWRYYSIARTGKNANTLLSA